MKVGQGGYNPSGCTCRDGACLSSSGNIITPTPQANYTNPPTQTTQPTQSQVPTAFPSSIPPQESCGNGICNYWETTSNCPRDCRSAETPYPTYIPPSKPSTACNTDKDCAWLITNSCPESAGAIWVCGSSNEQLIKNPNPICSGTLSPKPPVNCGCIQNTCSVFEREKPKEPPKKIGNTEVDATTLLYAVIQMEQLKVKFDFLKSAMVKLSKYYNATGKPDQSSRWLDASRMMDNAIFRLESLKVGIRSKISSFSIDDLRQLKKDVKSVIGTLKDVVRVILGGSTPATPISPSAQPISPTNKTNQTNATISSAGGGYGQGVFNITNQTNATSYGCINNILCTIQIIHQTLTNLTSNQTNMTLFNVTNQTSTTLWCTNQTSYYQTLTNLTSNQTNMTIVCPNQITCTNITIYQTLTNQTSNQTNMTIPWLNCPISIYTNHNNQTNKSI